MIYQSPLSYSTLELIRNSRRYNKVLKALAQELPGPNKGLYILIIRDLLFHFNKTKNSICRSQISHKGYLWNADSYRTITERINKNLKPPVTEKTVKRYHNHLNEKGWIRRCRKFFAGKNTLHRSLCVVSLEAAIRDASSFNPGHSDPDEVRAKEEKEELTQNIDGAKRKDILSGNLPDGIAATAEESGDFKGFIEQTIEFGHLLFGLGRLNDTKKRATQQARARIGLLVDAHILGPLFLLCLKDAIDHGEFQHQGIPLSHKFWPNWLDVWYPEDGETTPYEGAAASYFAATDASDMKWMNEQQRRNFYACQRAFEAYGRDINSAAAQRDLVKEEKVVKV